MKQKILILFFGILAYSTTACEIEAGRLGYIKNETSYQIFLSKQPKNTCYLVDSFTVRLTIFCKETSLQKVVEIRKPTDTVNVEILGDVIISASTYWHGGRNGRTDLKPLCIFENQGGCFEVLPEMSTENPPPVPVVLPNIYALDGYVFSNVGGILVSIDMQTSQAQIYEFPANFQWEIPSGYP